jgi:hypothetical protein
MSEKDEGWLAQLPGGEILQLRVRLRRTGLISWLCPKYLSYQTNHRIAGCDGADEYIFEFIAAGWQLLLDDGKYLGLSQNGCSSLTAGAKI